MHALLFAASCLIGDVPLTLPKEIKGKSGEFVVIRAETACPVVRFVILDAGPNLFPADLLKDEKVCVLLTLKPGTYRVLAYTAKGDVPSLPVIVSVIIEGETPPPPPPTPPQPVDPLAERFQTAYAADKEPAASKRGQLANLIGLYQAIAELTRDVNHFKNLGDVLTDLQKTAKSMLRADALIEVRKLIAAEVNSTLGTNPTIVLDATMRPRVADCFTRIAKALEQVK